MRRYVGFGSPYVQPAFRADRPREFPRRRAAGRYGVSVWLRGFVDAVPLSAWVFFAALAIVLAITVLTVTVRSWRTAGENPVDSVKTE